MSRRWLTPFALIVALSSAGCADRQAGTAAAAKVQPVAGGLDPANFRTVWMNILGLESQDRVNRIYIDKNLVFVGTPQNIYYLIDRAGGTLRNSVYINSDNRLVGRPVVLTNYIVYPAQSTLEVYKPNGTFVRSIKTGFTISSDAVANGNELYLGADLSGGELAQMDLTRADDPETQGWGDRWVHWRLMTFGEVHGRPAVFRDTVFVGSGSGSVLAVNGDRTPSWDLTKDEYKTDGPILGDVSADETGVYAASSSGRLVCLDRDSGKLKWQYLSPSPLITGPVVTAKTVYQFVPGKGLAALDKLKTISIDPEGKRTIEQQVRTPRWIAPDAVQFVAEDQHYTYIRTVVGELWALDYQTGQVRYRGHGVEFAGLATNTTDNIIYGVMKSGVVYALRPAIQPGGPGYIQ